MFRRKTSLYVSSARKKMSQREENARINTADDLEQFGHKSSQNSKPNSKIRINPNLSSKNIIPVMIIYT